MARRKSPLVLLREDLGGNDQLASHLSELTGDEVTGADVGEKIRKGMFPKAWREALGIEPEPRFRHGDDELPDAGSREAQPPKPKTQELLDLDWAQARTAIVAIYSGLGQGYAMVTKDKSVANIIDGVGLPAGSKSPAEVLADDWIALARVDERARKIVRALTVAGPSGKIAVDHLVLVNAIMSRKRADGRVEPPRPQEIVELHPDGFAAGDGAVGPVAAA